MPLVATGAVVLAGAVLVFLRSARKRGRVRDLSSLSSRRGLSFEERLGAFPPHFSEFEVLKFELGRRALNVMRGEVRGHRVAIYDLRLGTDSPRMSVSQTIVEVETPKAAIPYFRLEPETVIHKMQESVQAEDVDFDTHPKFSDEYLLRGESEPRIRELFSKELLEWFEGHLGLCVEARGERILVYRPATLLDAAEVDALLDAALDLSERLVTSERREPDPSMA